MQRMVEDVISTPFALFSSHLSAGSARAVIRRRVPVVRWDTFDLEALKALDIIVTCQGGDYTNEIYPKLRAKAAGRVLD